MESIPYPVRVRKGGLGYTIEGQKGHYYGSKPPIRTRGDISAFSSASRRRLRVALASARHIRGGLPFGITLTIPGRILSADEVRRLWHDFVANHLRKAFNDCLFIWRIELQKRKQAHWHCIAWISGDFASRYSVAYEIANHWRDLVCRLYGPFEEKTFYGFNEHGVLIQSLDVSSASGIIGYLCDHASKHKQDQLGWQGRQWGIVNRSQMEKELEIWGEFSERQHILAARQYRRLQKALRERGGSYTGIKVGTYTGLCAAIFGNDAERLKACYKVAVADNHPYTPSKAAISADNNTKGGEI